MTQQLTDFANDNKHLHKVLHEISGTLGKLVDKISNMQIQLADQRKEKDDMLVQI
jgi:hypothetical protein